MYHRITTPAPERTSARPSAALPPIGLPPIGTWWTLLDRGLQREILANPTAPLRPFVVRRVFELCGLGIDGPPVHGLLLGANERAYIAGWAHAVDWT
ncbi:hypothetical protein [Agromyces aureus]|uniref:Uncharacterized protein n=1 Tax=Agromyces aureus TaxID=453304 RepID=A0A191WDR1_9MICO|nr:hypothetical protein [Agromyces aureus]ANJ26406.1 hypothetical protein ATC03_06405 [Agromyces aureus]